jgi:hypothetical protein
MRLTGLLLSLITISAVLFGQQPDLPQGPPQGAPQGNNQGAPDVAGRPVARLSVLSGDVTVRRGDSGEWVAAALNAPIMAGDSVAVPAGGAAELQLDSANFVRMAGDTELRLSEFENGRYQIQVPKGLVTWRVLRESNAMAEISTPLIAVHPLRLSAVRVEIAPDSSTRVTVRHGDAEVQTPKGTERVHEGNMMMVRGSADDPEYQVVSASAHDQWDTWSDQRDAYLLRAQSPRYVSPDVYGTEDMDANGHWNYDPAYGWVWMPTAVAANWAPYQNGQWVWEDYYGWTWVDYDPWGWAPFHYGSWYYRGGPYGWCWFPGSRLGRYFWRPALVGFVGFGGGVGFGVGFGFGNIGWIPLAPFEIFHPWYGAGWFGGRGLIGNNINIVRNANIGSLYRNARIANGVTGVSASDFQRGNFRNTAAVDRAQLQSASMVRGAVPVTPSSENLRFSNRAASSPGGSSIGSGLNQRFYSRTSTSSASAQRTPFAQQQATVRSAFENRGFQTGGGQAGVSNRGGSASVRSAQPGTGGTSQWQRFGNSQSGGERQSGASAQRSYQGSGYGSAGASRSLQVAPPIMRQRESAPSSSYNRSGGSYSQPAYRSAPSSSAPSYRAPAASPGYRSAPAPSYHGSSSGGGGGHGSSGGGHSGGGRR